VYFRAAAVITVLVLLGQVLELRARALPRGDPCALGLALNRAAHHRKGDEDVAIDAIAAGDLLRCAGEKDSGRWRRHRRPSAVDESMVTGESMPVSKAEADKSSVARQPERQGWLRAEVGRATMCRMSEHVVAADAAARRSTRCAQVDGAPMTLSASPSTPHRLAGHHGFIDAERPS